MKKKILVLTLMAISLAASAQRAFTHETKVINLYAGFGSPYWNSGLKTSFPVNPGISYERGITDHISAGAGLGYSSSKYEFDEYKLKYRAIFISGRGAWHFPAAEKLDPYAGASLGYVLVSVTSSGYGAAGGSGIGYGFFGGLRYYPSKKIGLLAEAGYNSFSFLSAGISIKL